MDKIFQILALLEGTKLTITDDVQCGQYANECYGCVHLQDVPGNAHVRCDSPCARISGDRHGIENGWFMYPKLFDPIWRTSECQNFISKNEESNAVSLAVSDAVSHVA